MFTFVLKSNLKKVNSQIDLRIKILILLFFILPHLCVLFLLFTAVLYFVKHLVLLHFICLICLSCAVRYIFGKAACNFYSERC